jgi:pimeloyl-ACP methyl ester carboxylesterase
MQSEAFAARYRVVAYSRRCHYPNPWIAYPPDYSLATERDDLAAFLRRMNLASVRLVGSSYGAYTAALVARDHPELVRSLVLGEPPILALLVGNSPTGTLYAQFQRHLVHHVQPLLRANQLEEGVRAFIDGVIGPGAFDQMPSSVREVTLQNARTLAAEVGLTPERDPFTCDDARRIRVPTLLLRGERSPAFLHRILDELVRCLPQHETVTIPAASHAMHLQNPSAYNEAVLRFFAQH